jgi:hypothetical protein
LATRGRESDFENESELSRWEGGAHFPGDWSGRAGLAFSVFNPGGEVKLHYRVHDILHRGNVQQHTNRFNGDTVLHPGWNDIVIPMNDILYGLQGRTMDVTKIRGFGLFVIRQADSRVLYLDNVRLF